MTPCAPAGQLNDETVDVIGSVAIAWALISVLEDVPATPEVQRTFEEGRAVFYERLKQAGFDKALTITGRTADIIAFRGAGTSDAASFDCSQDYPEPRGGGAMAKQPKNHGKTWTPNDVSKLRGLAKENTPTRVIGLKMGRTPDSVQSKASEKNISLKPTNQSPYGRRKK